MNQIEEIHTDCLLKERDDCLSQGELNLLKGDLDGISDFERANTLVPNHPASLYRQALALLACPHEAKERLLSLASKKFKQVLALQPEHVEAWHLLGNTLVSLGKTHKDAKYFLEAEEKYRQAFLLSKEENPDLLWDYGLVWTHIGNSSKEPLDLQYALDAFQKACLARPSFPVEFWLDFGRTALNLAERINDLRLYTKAIQCFKHAISVAPSYEAWLILASALQSLYDKSHDEDHFVQANDAFSKAAKLSPQEAEMWLAWGTFLAHSGRHALDVKRLRASIEKCHRAYACNPDLPKVYAQLAETLALLGELTDQLDLIHEAQNKIIKASELDPSLPDVWYSYGMCLNSFGRYFNDLDYHYQAIEKLQQGLSLDRTYHRLWHAMAETYARVGSLESNEEDLRLACKFHTRAIDLEPKSYYLIDYALSLSRLGEISSDKSCLEDAVTQFERALHMQKNAAYLHPEWLFEYASTLDKIGDFHEEESYYARAIEIFSHVVMIDPDFPDVHHQLALAFSHMGELTLELEHFHRALHHFRIAAKRDEENDQVILDWGISLINIAEETSDSSEREQRFRDAEHKLLQAARFGNIQAFYHLSGLYSLLGQYDNAIYFLEKSLVNDSLPPLEEVCQDEWLSGLRTTQAFQDFLDRIERRISLLDT